MSTLSETLERHLRELQNPTPTPPPTKQVNPNVAVHSTIMKSVHLEFIEGTSDKEYNIQIIVPDTRKFNEYEVNFQYGRRGGTLTHGSKTISPVTWKEAVLIYDKLKAEKIAKGYK